MAESAPPPPPVPAPDGSSARPRRGRVRFAATLVVLLVVSTVGSYLAVSAWTRAEGPDGPTVGDAAAAAPLTDNRARLSALGVDPDDTRGPVDPVAERAAVLELLEERPAGVHAAVVLTCESVPVGLPTMLAIGPERLLAAVPEDTLAAAVRIDEVWRTASPVVAPEPGLVLLEVDGAVGPLVPTTEPVVPLRGQTLAVRDGRDVTSVATVTAPGLPTGGFEIALERGVDRGALVTDAAGRDLGILARRGGRTIVLPVRAPSDGEGTAVDTDCGGPGRGPASSVPVRAAEGLTSDAPVDVVVGRLTAILTALNQRTADRLPGLGDDGSVLPAVIEQLGRDTIVWDVEVTAVGPAGEAAADPSPTARTVALEYVEVDRAGCWLTEDRLTVRVDDRTGLRITAWDPSERRRNAC